MSSGFSLPPLNAAKRTKRLWSASEVRKLRDLAAQGETLGEIAAVLRRSSIAVRTKAAMHGISIGEPRRHPSS